MIKKVILLFVLSGFAQVYLQAQTRPDQPMGLTGLHDPLYRFFTILWEPVKQTSDGSPITDLAGYNVYRRTTPRGAAVKINPYLLPVNVFADRADGKTFYYSIRAVDKDGLESADSLLVDSSRKANIIFLVEDGTTDLVIPGDSAKILRPNQNKYGVPLTIKFEEEADINAEVIRNIRFQIVRGDTKEGLKDFSCLMPDAQIHIGYNMIGGQIALGAPGEQSIGTAPTISATPGQISLYWFNGVDWIKLGGSHNFQAQTVDITSAQLGSYQLRVSAPENSLVLAKANVFPGLFTPNGDGYNDRVYMVLENPNNASISGEIYDLAGRLVAKLPAPTQSAGIGTTLVWNGQDSSGSVVPSGLYLYRIQGDEKSITGTIAVAK